MTRDINPWDPEWAWSAYEPDDANPWNRRRAAHLLRRAGFAATEEQLAAAVQASPLEVVDRLVDERPDRAFEDEMRVLTQAALAAGDPQRLSPVWLYRMLRTSAPLLEKMTLFWHGHFATSAAKVEDAGLMQRQNDLLRRLAFAPFGQLVQEISRDPAMLVYLDSATNRKGHPNENYARELLELFSMGEGNYRERDILELARCFTGWQIRRGEFHFNRYQHDFGAKRVFDEEGPFGGEEAVEVVLRQPQVAMFITRKLARYFLCDEPALSDALLAPLAEDFRQHDLDIAHLARRILGSRLFFSPTVQGRRIRSPVDLAVGLLRSLDGTTNTVELSQGLAELGQHLFYPPNVKGWEGGRNWINSSTLLGRANLVQQLLRSPATRFAGGTLEQWAERQGLHDAGSLISWLEEVLVAVPLSAEIRERLTSLAEHSPGDRDARLSRMVHALAALPEFQLG